MLKWRILTIREEVGQDASGRVVPVVRIDYFVGDHGPFTERLPRAEFGPAEVQRRLNQMAHQVSDLVGG